MTDNQVIESKRVGDIKEVADLLGLSEYNVSKILTRPNAKRHPEVIKTLRAIVTARIELKNSIQQSKNDSHV